MGRLSPSLRCFLFFLSRLSVHAQCHILIPRSSKLIRDNTRLMETFPLQKAHPFPLFLSRTPTLSCHFFPPSTTVSITEEKTDHKSIQNTPCDSYCSSDHRSVILSVLYQQLLMCQKAGQGKLCVGPLSPGKSRLTVAPMVNKLRGERKGRRMRWGVRVKGEGCE